MGVAPRVVGAVPSGILGVLYSVNVRTPGNGVGGMGKVYCDGKIFVEASGGLQCQKDGTYKIAYTTAQTYSSSGGLNVGGERKISIPGNAAGTSGSIELEIAAGDIVSLSVTASRSESGRYASMAAEIERVK